MKHEYSEILQAIAVDKNVKLQRTFANSNRWENIDVTAALNIILHGCADQIRVALKTMRIGNVDVLMPMKVAPALNTEYWVVDIGHKGLVRRYIWDNCNLDVVYLQRNLCHSTKADCLIHAEALIKLNGGTL